MTRPRIVVGIDGSPAADAALDWALEEARRRQAGVEVIHAWHVSLGADSFGSPIAAGVLVSLSEDEARSVLESALERADVTGVPHLRTTLVHSGADEALLSAAHDADLLVVGARSHHGLAGAVLGSVADDVVHRATCPVAVIPAAGRTLSGK